MDGFFFGKNNEMNGSKNKKGLAFAKPFFIETLQVLIS